MSEEELLHPVLLGNPALPEPRLNKLLRDQLQHHQELADLGHAVLLGLEARNQERLDRTDPESPLGRWLRSEGPVVQTRVLLPEEQEYLRRMKVLKRSLR